MPWLLVVGGAYFGLRNVRYFRDEQALRSYMETSPKATLWVRKYGIDGATRLARQTFLPLGILASLAMVAVGSWSLWRQFT